MSEFFGGLNYSNVRFTDARINGDGPLPTSLSGPEGINGDPDGRYNFNDALLSGIAPYAGPQGGRMGSDRNYQQIPHRKQYPVPMIYLPEPAWDAQTTFNMSHPIDMGDLVFVLNMNYKHFVFTGSHAAVQDAKNNTMPLQNVFCNICTVNYLLAGFHNYAMHYVTQIVPASQASQHAWFQLMRCLNVDEDLKYIQTKYGALGAADQEQFKKTLLLLHIKLLLQKLIRDNIKPLGICSASEKQGGQHETGLKPVQAAASFFVTLTVDGQNRDLVNIWRAVDVEGGDLLLVQLQYSERDAQGNRSISQNYVLNHYYKGWVQRSMQMEDSCKGLFQLVPGVWRTAFGKRKTSNLDTEWQNFVVAQLRARRWRGDVSDQHLKKVSAVMLDSVMDNRNLGYWHIGQVYNKQGHFATEEVPTDDMQMTKGQLLQINFAPVWHGRTMGEAEPITQRIFGTLPATHTGNEELYLEDISSHLVSNHIEHWVWFDLLLRYLLVPYGSDAVVTRLHSVITQRRFALFVMAVVGHLPQKPAIVAAGPRILPLHGTAGDAGFHLDSMSADLEVIDASSVNATLAPETLATAAETSDADAVPAKRFKKAVVVAEGTASSSQTTAEPSVQASAAADSGWNFEEEMEAYLATEARARSAEVSAPPDKPRTKTKSKAP